MGCRRLRDRHQASASSCAGGQICECNVSTGQWCSSKPSIATRRCCERSVAFSPVTRRRSSNWRRYRNEAPGLSRERRVSVILWRIAAEMRKYAADDLSGGGAAAHPGRWNDSRERVVYCAPTIAMAVLETAAHIDDAGLPLIKYLVEIAIPDPIWVLREQRAAATLPVTWDAVPSSNIGAPTTQAARSDRKIPHAPRTGEVPRRAARACSCFSGARDAGAAVG